ncbi:MAG: cation:proton antiporter [Candidatus Ornithospirochaeta sp.]|nr:cation:proton antiporter [Sphaerochaetaceae bacterium]MDY5524378.1 cation:proton antiporter [Candidatus Ornithospirochaeta sp.]
MEYMLILLSFSILSGLIMSRAAKMVNLPSVTAYLVAGLLIGPFVLGRAGIRGIGFSSMEEVNSFSIISQAALGFIAFEIGNEFRLKDLKTMGRSAITVGILQAVITTIVVDIALLSLHFLFPSLISMSSAITLGAIAAATAPAATLMVVKQYKAQGPMTKLLLMVVAIDDAVGLVLFSLSFGMATAMETGAISITGVLVEPLVELVLSILLGVLGGVGLNVLEKYFHSRSKRMSLAVAFVMMTVGVSMLTWKVGGVKCGFSLLLVCMVEGTVFCNINETSQELMDRVDRWTGPLNMLFFVLSGAELDLSVLSNPMVLFIGLVFIAFRSLGKISGAYLSCRMEKTSPIIQKYLGITLLPQAGVALGMALTARNLADGEVVGNVVLFAVLLYELFGPTLTKWALLKAGEISIEGKKSARTPNSGDTVGMTIS